MNSPPIPPQINPARTGILSGRMGTVFAILGVIFLALIVIGGGVVGYLIYKGSALDRSSKAYVDEAIPAIVTSWTPDQLVKRESKVFQKATNDDQLVQLFAAFRKLGALKTYKGSKGESNVTITTGSGKVVTATYTGQATFENGDADIKLFLIQQDGQWKIQGFRVYSPFFSKRT